MISGVGHAWGKLRLSSEGEPLGCLALADHGADVAACAEVLLRHPLTARRLARLAGRADEALPPVWIDRLCVIAFLHDCGKANAGFQRKWRKGAPPVGHLDELSALFDRDDLVTALGLPDVAKWGSPSAIGEALRAAFAHHGYPAKLEDATRYERHWRADGAYDPAHALRALALAAREAYPRAYAPGGLSLPEPGVFWHAYAGLLMLADWLGSDEAAFPFERADGRARIVGSREIANKLVAEIGYDAGLLRGEAPSEFTAVSPHPPSEIQRLAGEAEGRIVVLEAETGSGKTEAALYRFARLFAQGRVEGLYFALPTRVAATALYERVCAAVQRMFPREPRPVVVQAVPGYAAADGAQARLLPGFEVQWDDQPDAAVRRARWAAERPKRFLAGTIAVGTIDQALLGTILVRHAHLRAFCLMRSLLVVDEVHASDFYMENLLGQLLRLHDGAGGEALLLSATLGSGARERLLRLNARARPPTPEAAAALPYPAVSRLKSGRVETLAAAGRGRTKVVEIEPDPRVGEPLAVAERALAAARAGAKVLVVRNTVGDAVSSLRALLELGAEENLLFRVNGRASLHHGRFARVDRMLLDRAVESAVGRERAAGGLVLIGTQTLEQSLDIDADLIITDLAPIDVLLQRLGRLHRHERTRPVGFSQAQAVVLAPASLDPWLARPGAHGFGGKVYDDLVALEAVRGLIGAGAVWRIPAMNRELVEAGTHDDVLEALATNRAAGDPRWRAAWQEHKGRERARNGTATTVKIDWHEAFSRFQVLDERIGSRLGLRDAEIVLDAPPLGPFGRPIPRLVVPGWWDAVVTAIAAGEPAREILPTEDGFTLRIRDERLRYGAYGLQNSSGSR